MASPKEQRPSCFSDSLPAREGKRPYYEILRPVPGGEVSAIITSEKALITYSHYFQHVSYRCLTNRALPLAETECPFCAAGSLARIKAYLCGIDVKGKRRCAVEMTEHACWQLMRQEEAQGSLRGKQIWLSRPGRASNAPVRARIGACTVPTIARNLPLAFDLEALLLEMWLIPHKDILKGFEFRGNHKS